MSVALLFCFHMAAGFSSPFLIRLIISKIKEHKIIINRIVRINYCPSVFEYR